MVPTHLHLHRILRLAWLPVLLLSLQGCMGPPDLLQIDDGGGYTMVEVSLRALGAPPQNVTGASLTFTKLVFFEKDSGQWVHVPTRARLTFDFNEPAETPLATVTLPLGRYTEASGQLDQAVLFVNGEPVQAQVPTTRCTTAIHMDLTNGPTPPGLVLFFWVQDAIEHDEGQWSITPAFSASKVQEQTGDPPAPKPSDPDRPAGHMGPTNGNGIRFGEPRCDPGGPKASSMPRGAP